MQELVAGMERLRVDLEADVEQQGGAQPLPFPGECSIKDCPFLHVDTTVNNSRACPWYDRGFCRNGPSCKYKHRRRVMCANYLVGFCPEGPNCKFMHLKAGLLTHSVDPAKGARCPQGLAPAAGGESSPEDVLAPQSTGQRSPGTAAASPPSLQWLLEPGTCFKCGQKGHYAGKCRKNQLEILLGK
ncbi:putative cleavage and polyadenylation specificity factor subunit 4-like protein isoform X2 [Anas acuta]|uniref:putative cleavage and polyadenylation specificity factor subunit 4-like protein isoform X2 n=1 Tax=Anas acuta TaxID=28680 RepID=UPI0035C937F3